MKKRYSIPIMLALQFPFLMIGVTLANLIQFEPAIINLIIFLSLNGFMWVWGLDMLSKLRKKKVQEQLK